MFDIVEHTFSILNCDEIKAHLPDQRIYYIHAEDAKTPYLEFANVNEQGVKWAENGEIATDYLIQVDIFSHNSEYWELEKLIKEKLISNGYVRLESVDLYEANSTKLYHRAMRFRYIHYK